MSLLVVNELGAPQPPEDVVKALAQTFGPEIGMLAVEFPWGYQWAFTERWGEADPRRERVRNGELDPGKCFDVLGYPDVPIRSAHDAMHFLAKQLKPRAATKAEYAEMLGKAERFNADQQKRNESEVIDYAVELAAANTSTLFRDEQGPLGGKRVIKVYQTEPGRTKRKGRDL